MWACLAHSSVTASLLGAFRMDLRARRERRHLRGARIVTTASPAAASPLTCTLTGVVYSWRRHRPPTKNVADPTFEDTFTTNDGASSTRTFALGYPSTANDAYAGFFGDAGSSSISSPTDMLTRYLQNWSAGVYYGCYSGDKILSGTSMPADTDGSGYYGWSAVAEALPLCADSHRDSHADSDANPELLDADPHADADTGTPTPTRTPTPTPTPNGTPTPTPTARPRLRLQLRLRPRLPPRRRRPVRCRRRTARRSKSSDCYRETLDLSAGGAPGQPEPGGGTPRFLQCDHIYNGVPQVCMSTGCPATIKRATICP